MVSLKWLGVSELKLISNMGEEVYRKRLATEITRIIKNWRVVSCCEMGCPVVLLGWFERFREYICSMIVKRCKIFLASRTYLQLAKGKYGKWMKMMGKQLQSKEWANIESKALLTVHTMFVVILGLAWLFRKMAACRVAPEIKASKTFQDILGKYAISMSSISIGCFCWRSYYSTRKHYIMQYMGACCPYLYMWYVQRKCSFFLLFIKMYRVHMLYIYIYIYLHLGHGHGGLFVQT